MTANSKASDATGRRLRLGMVGGGPGAFIGAVHRIAARMDDRFELGAGALASYPSKSKAAALELRIPGAPSARGLPEKWGAGEKRGDGVCAVAVGPADSGAF